MIPEMLVAGMEAYREAVERELPDHDLVIAVFLAMRGIEEIASMKREFGVTEH